MYILMLFSKLHNFKQVFICSTIVLPQIWKPQRDLTSWLIYRLIVNAPPYYATVLRNILRGNNYAINLGFIFYFDRNYVTIWWFPVPPYFCFYFYFKFIYPLHLHNSSNDCQYCFLSNSEVTQCYSCFFKRTLFSYGAPGGF